MEQMATGETTRETATTGGKTRETATTGGKTRVTTRGKMGTRMLEATTAEVKIPRLLDHGVYFSVASVADGSERV